MNRHVLAYYKFLSARDYSFSHIIRAHLSLPNYVIPQVIYSVALIEIMKLFAAAITALYDDRNETVVVWQNSMWSSIVDTIHWQRKCRFARETG